MNETRFNQSLRWIGVVLLALFTAVVAGLILYVIFGEVDDKGRRIFLVLVALALVPAYFIGDSHGKSYRSGFEAAHSHAPATASASAQTPVTSGYAPQSALTDRLPASYDAISPELSERVMQAVKGSEL